MAIHIRSRRSIADPIDALHESAREVGAEATFWVKAARDLGRATNTEDRDAYDVVTQLMFRGAVRRDHAPRAL